MLYFLKSCLRAVLISVMSMDAFSDFMTGVVDFFDSFVRLLLTVRRMSIAYGPSFSSS